MARLGPQEVRCARSEIKTDRVALKQLLVGQGVKSLQLGLLKTVVRVEGRGEFGDVLTVELVQPYLLPRLR